ncbi:DUF4383 domain-containing protein [Saccharomonospora sp. NPDC006951]
MTSSASTPATVPHVSWPRLVVLVIGAVFLALGIAGFVTHGDAAGVDHSRTVLGFGVSGLLNIVHIAAGVLGLLAARKSATTRVYGWLLFFAFAGLTAYTIFATVIGGPGDIVNVNAANACLYGLSCAVGLVIALLPEHRPQR